MRRKIRLILHRISIDLRLQPLTVQRYTLLHYQRIRHQRGIVSKTLIVTLFSAIYIQVIRIHTGYHGHIRTQMMKRTVVFIRLYHHIITLGVNQQIRMIIIGYTTQKSITSHLRTIEQMRQHSARSGLTVRTRHT